MNWWIMATVDGEIKRIVKYLTATAAETDLPYIKKYGYPDAHIIFHSRN